MSSGDQNTGAPFEVAVLKAKIAQICESVGFHAITQDSFNHLIDIYRRTLHHLARHCKEAANNNGRVEPTMMDLVQAYDFVRISIPELLEHIETVKLPLNIEISQDEQKASNRIQRNLHIDDLLEAEKKSHLEDQDDAENKELSEDGDDEEKPSIPLLRDTYEELTSKFPNPIAVTADKKLRLGGRILLVANTKLKISASTSHNDSKPTKKIPLDPTIAEPPSFLPLIQQEQVAQPDFMPTTTKGTKQTKGKRKKKSTTKLEKKSASKLEKKSASKLEKKSTAKLAKTIKKESTPVPPPAPTPTPSKDPTPPPPTLSATPAPLPSPIPSKSSTPTPTKQTKCKRKNKSEPQISSKKIKTKQTSKSKSKVKLEPPSPPIPTPLPIRTPTPALPTTTATATPSPVSTPKPIPTTSKQPKGKKKKKSGNQFAIVTETVTAEEKEWLCPGCGGPDDGDIMIECDSCQEWFHLGCTNLKKAPEDNENWECDICANKAKALKRSQAAVEVLMMKTPELVVKTPPVPELPATTTAGTSQDDSCPECNLPDDGTMMIQCDDPFCAKWFHGKCINLLEEPKDDESWFCKACVEKQQSAFKRRRRAK